MGRPAKFSREVLLQAAADIVAREGPAALTAAALARAIGAPSGSVYHRFESVGEILGEVWVRTVAEFQEGFVAALEVDGSETLASAVRAARYVPSWSREHLGAARLLLLFRREELLKQVTPQIASELARQNAVAAAAIRAWSRSHFLRVTTQALEVVKFAIVDVPYGAVYRHLAAGRAPPERVDDLVETTCRAILAGDEPRAKNRRRS